LVAIKGLEKFAPKDFPGFISATLFVGGCNFRCPFCHNADLVLRPGDLPTFPMDYILGFLDSRKDWLEGVCITGGEPLMFEEIEVLFQIFKDRNLLVKVDTNGSFPDRLKDLIDKGLVDNVAMDIKSSFDKYEEAAGVSVDVESIRRSVEVIRESGLELTFRTTAVPELIDAEEIKKIGQMLEGAKLFQLQQFSPEGALDPAFQNLQPYPPEKIMELSRIAELYFAEVRIEGI